MLPWGVPTAQVVNTQAKTTTESFQTPDLIKLPANSLTTDQFDQQFVNKISTLTTDKTFSWIVTKPIDYYNVSNYFIGEILTQFFVGLLIAFLLFHSAQNPLKQRLIQMGIVSLLAVAGINAQYFNWWGVPTLYIVGTSCNLIVGWMLASFISAKWIIKSVQ